ncbi:hypothetical protein A2U01_0080155, partial [Trifolium medium]|nr:hypothetical protein [Trifolium medium]
MVVADSLVAVPSLVAAEATTAGAGTSVVVDSRCSNSGINHH